jgi:radical SAM superfamily enzyme YgiQ (UPF0313 family)
MKDKKNIILAKTIRDESELFVPLGLLYIAGALEKAGYNCIIWHERERKLPQLYELVKEVSPIFVGFSSLTGPDLLPTIKASRVIRKMSIPVVWGGVHVSVLPEFCLRQDYIDFVIVGEGEEAIVELAEALTKRVNYCDIKGLGYKVDGRIFINPLRSLIKNLDNYFPLWEKIDLERYYQRLIGQERVLPIVTSRGCPHKCGFCYNQTVNRQIWRKHSIDFVVSQVKFLQEKYVIDGIYFYDDNFFTNVERAKKIIELVNLPYFAEIRADYLTGDLVKWLGSTKCRELYIGAESGSGRILEKIDKNLEVEDIKLATRLLSETKITISLSFITGFPGEEKEDTIKTLELMKELQEMSPTVRTPLKAFTPYPGIPLWEDAIVHGFLPPQNNEEWAKYTRENSQLPWLSKWQLLAMQIVTSYMANDFAGCYWRKIIQTFMKWRWEKKFFRFPVEVIIGRKILSLCRRLIFYFTT